MAVTLRAMSDDEFALWLPSMRDRYADDIARDFGASTADARKKASVDLEKLFPGDRPVEGQFVFVIEADGAAVGDLWLAERETELGRGLWVYDVHVDEEHRGRGYGKAAMRLAETEARRHSLSAVFLNVFGGNEVARNLYRSLGYRENAVFMSKHF
jgi:ribosomal protein S18 acetylase RimI-like enzyme